MTPCGHFEHQFCGLRLQIKDDFVWAMSSAFDLDQASFNARTHPQFLQLWESIMKLHNAALAVVSLALMTDNFAAAQDAQQTDVKKNIEQRRPDYSPYPNQNFPNRVYWGVAHVHTGYSFDFGIIRGNADPRRPL